MCSAGWSFCWVSAKCLIDDLKSHTSAFPGSPKLIKGGFVIHDPAYAQPFRLKEPAIESIRRDEEIDATYSLEHPDQNANAFPFGVAPQLAALESLLKLSSAELLALNALTQTGTLEILPAEAPMLMFNRNKSRVVPVREEARRSELEKQDGASFKLRAAGGAAPPNSSMSGAFGAFGKGIFLTKSCL